MKPDLFMLICHRETIVRKLQQVPRGDDRWSLYPSLEERKSRVELERWLEEVKRLIKKVKE